MLKNKCKIYFVLSLVFMITFAIGCSNKKESGDMSRFINTMENNLGYDVKYFDERKAVRISEYLPQSTVVEAISDNVAYDQWVAMRSDFLDLFESIKKLGDVGNLDNVKYELLIIDKDTANTEKEIPLLIINEKGVIFDIVEKVKNKN